MTQKTYDVTLSFTAQQLQQLRRWRENSAHLKFTANPCFTVLRDAELPSALPEVVPGNLVRVWWSYGEQHEGTAPTGEVVVRVDDSGFDTAWLGDATGLVRGRELETDDVAGCDRYNFADISRIEILLDKTPGVRL